MTSTRPARSRRKRNLSPLLLLSALLAAAALALPAEASLPRADANTANTAALAGAEAVDSSPLIAAGLEKPFSLPVGDELEKAQTCHPAPSLESLSSAEGAPLEPPQLASRACATSFSLHLEPVDFGLNPQRGPPLEIPDLHQGWSVADPKTRIGGFRLDPEDFIGGERSLSLGLHRGYLVGRPGFTEDEPPDPWGLQGKPGKLAELTEKLIEGGYRVGGRSITHAGRFKGREVTTAILRVETAVSTSLLQNIEKRFPGLRIPYDEAGLVQFERASANVVYDNISIGKFTGNSKAEIEDAWKAYAKREGLTGEQLSSLRGQYTMHHSYESGRMLLVDTDVHSAYRHTGGDALTRAGIMTSIVGAAVLPRTSEAREKGAGLKQQAVAFGTDLAMSTTAGAVAEAPETIDATSKWIGGRMWDHFKRWLDGLAASGEAREKAVREIEK